MEGVLPHFARRSSMSDAQFVESGAQSSNSCLLSSSPAHVVAGSPAADQGGFLGSKESYSAAGFKARVEQVCAVGAARLSV